MEIHFESDPLAGKFRESRKKFAPDPYRPRYHFVSPEGRMNDPNGLCFWRGRWHLFYQGFPPGRPGVHWGHAVSGDLVRWKDLPYAICPGPERDCYSGSTFVENDRVIAMYYGTTAGNMVAVSSDPLLLNWTKLAGNPVIPQSRGKDRAPLPYNVFDPCIWKKDDFYYSLSGGRLPEGPGGKPVRANFLFRSKDLAAWEYLHPFVEGDRFTLVGDDGACPYFWPIGDKHILLFFSHMSGGQALIGDYDRERDKFMALSHHKFNFGATAPGGVHAPSACPDGGGGVIAVFNMNAARPCGEWDQIMTIPRRLSLKGEEICVEPAGAVESLRREHKRAGRTELPANEEIVLKGIEGDTAEIEAEIETRDSPVVEFNVLRSPDRAEFTRISFFGKRGYENRQHRTGELPYGILSLDTSHSSLAPDALPRPPENAPVLLEEGEPLKLRIFIDKSVVEVFANNKQCLAARVYPSRRDSLTASLQSRGKNAFLKSLNFWRLESIYGHEL